MLLPHLLCRSSGAKQSAAKAAPGRAVYGTAEAVPHNHRPAHGIGFVGRGFSRDNRPLEETGLQPLELRESFVQRYYQLFPTMRGGVISARLCRQPNIASRTRDIVFWATSRALSEPSSIIRKTLSGCATNSSRRARIGSIHLIRLSAIAVLHSMQPIPAVRQPSADHFNVSGGENSLCQS